MTISSCKVSEGFGDYEMCFASFSIVVHTPELGLPKWDVANIRESFFLLPAVQVMQFRLKA